jgi:tripartite-type tricarboxylate transporter receptor subunit TctC
LPTIAESGVTGFQTSVWFALWGPPNMPPDLVKKIHTDVAKALDLPQSREFFKTNSFERVDLSPAQFGALIESDLKHWSALIKAVGAKVE